MRLIITLFLLVPGLIFSQEDALVKALENVPQINVQQGSYKVKKESRPSYVLVLHGDKGEVEKQWRKYVENQYDCDFKKNKGVYEALGIRMPDITNETVSLYTAIEASSHGAKLSVMIDLGGKFVQGGTEGDKLKRALSSFGANFYDVYYGEVIDKQAKELDKADKATEKLEKEGEKLNKSLAGETESIKKANSNITKSEEEIESLTSKIEELRRSISASESKIKELEGNIEKNAAKTETSREAANVQRARVAKLKENHEAIKKR